MTRVVLRARATLPIVFACAAFGLAAAAWCLPSAYQIRLQGHARTMLPILPFVVGLLVGAWACTRPRVVIDEDGIRMRRVLAEVRLGWDDIVTYHYRSGVAELDRRLFPVQPLYELARARAARNPYRDLEDGALILTARDGRKIRFSPGLFLARTHVASAFDVALGELHARLGKRSDVAYPPLQIVGDRLVRTETGEPLPVNSIVKVVVGNKHPGFQIVHRAAGFKGIAESKPWLEAEVKDIANIWLLVEALRARAVPVEIDFMSFVPRDIAPVA